MSGVVIFDWRYFIIPDEISAVALVIGLCNAAIVNEPDAAWGIAAALAQGTCVAVLFILIRNIYRSLRKRDGIGLGDVKLAGVAGVWLSTPMVPIAVEVAALAALGAHLCLMGRASVSSRAFVKLPFGAFFAPAIWLCWLFEVTMDRAGDVVQFCRL